jgi:hypothetical protein
MILVLVEREEHVPEAAALLTKHGTGALLVAFSPSVIRTLRTNAIPFIIPERYISPRELSQWGLNNYDLLENLLQWAASYAEGLPDHLHLNPIAYDFYRLKLLVDSFSLRVRELISIIEKEKPDLLVVFRTDQDHVWASFESDSFIEHDGPIYAEIAPVVATTLHLKFEVQIVKHFGKPTWGTPGRQFRSGVRLMKTAAGFIFRAMRARGNQPVAWQFSDQSHDIPPLIKLFSKSFRVVLWENKWRYALFRRLYIARPKTEHQKDLQILEKWWKQNVEALSLHPIFQIGAFNYFPLVERAFQFRFIVGHITACEIFDAACSLIRRHRPAIAIGISSPYYQVMAFALALKRERIPIIFAQEGGLYGYCHTPMHHYYELSVADYFFAYGPGVADRLESLRLTSRQKARVITVGARNLLRTSSRPLSSSTAKRRIMYVPTRDFHHGLRYAPVHYSDRDYCELKQRILLALIERSDVDVIYKSMPGTLAHDSALQTIKEHRDRIEVIQGPLQQVLDKADVFVLDWPTTTLLEVLCTRRPVIVLMDQDALETIDTALPMLRRRARVFLNKDDFIKELRGGSLYGSKEDLNDSAFIDAFATGGNQAWTDEEIRTFPYSATMGATAL